METNLRHIGQVLQESHIGDPDDTEHVVFMCNGLSEISNTVSTFWKKVLQCHPRTEHLSGDEAQKLISAYNTLRANSDQALS
jgi:hypothetical protein